MKNKTMGGLSIAVMLLLNSSQAEAHKISSERKSPDSARDTSFVDMGSKMSALQLMLSKEEPNAQAPTNEEMLQIDSNLYMTTFEQVFAKVYHKSRGDDLDGTDIMAYSAMNASEAGSDDEPAFGAGGAIMEALAQSNPDIGLKKSAQNLAQAAKVSNKKDKKDNKQKKQIKKQEKDVSATQVEEDIKNNKSLPLVNKIKKALAKPHSKKQTEEEQLLEEKIKIEKEQTKEEKDLEVQILKEQQEAEELQKEIDSGKVSREQAMLASFTEGDNIEKQERADLDKDYLSKSLPKKKSILEMSAQNLEQQTLSETTSSMIGKAKKSVFRNLMTF